MKLLHDTPVTKDHLGFEPSVHMLRDVIVDTDPPFVIGVYGEWGCGKTTLMKMVKNELEDGHSDNIKTAWFNAWKYDGKEVIWNALIQEIFYTMSHDPAIAKAKDKAEFKKRLTETATALAKYAAKVATRIIPGGILKEDDVDELANAFGADDQEFAFVNQFESTFDAIVKEYVGEHGKLVVFIDDIDRCLPENAIAVFESLKLYLDRSNCMFVIGGERAIVEEGIRQRYKDNPRLSANEYLEKVVQLPFVMRGIESRTALSLLDPFEKTISYRGDAAMEKLIVVGTGCNPRRIKQFVNSFYVLSKIGKSESMSDPHRLAKILLIQIRFPAAYNALLQNLSILQYLTSVIQADSTQREQMLAAGSQAARMLYDDVELRRFLDRTQEVECGPDEIERWVLLTKGDARI